MKLLGFNNLHSACSLPSPVRQVLKILMAAINSTSSVPIPTSNFLNAINSLLQYVKSSNSKLEKSKLFEVDDLVYLLLTLTTIPAKDKVNPYRIPIPKPFHEFKSGSTSICLILDDTDKSPLKPEAAREEIKSRNLPIDHVIGLWELKSDYKAYESRRKLCNSYDMFFADRRILPMLPSFIGKKFFKTKKLPLAVNFSRVGWPDQIRAACESTWMFIKTGTSVALKIGRVGMDEEDILENALAVIEKAVEHVPKRWGGLRSVHVKASNSVALPIYQVVPEVGLKIEGVWDEEKKKKIAEGKKKRERDGDRKKERKAKKGRIGDVNVLDEAIGDEAVVENGDSDEKVEEENNGTNAKTKKDKKRKLSVEKSVVRKKKKASNNGKAIASEISKKKKRDKGVKVENEVSNKKGDDEKQLKEKKVKKSENTKAVKEVVDKPKEVEAETVESEASKKKDNGEKQLRKKVKKGEDKKKVEAETVASEASKKKGNGEKQLKKKVKKGEGKKKVEEVIDEPEEVVCSDSVGKKKKNAKKIKSVKSKTAAKSG